MPELTKLLDPIKFRIRDCANYKFGMHNADWLAHVDSVRLVAAIEVVTRLHTPGEGHNPLCHCGIEAGSGAACTECREEWPCPTIVDVAAALEGFAQ